MIGSSSACGEREKKKFKKFFYCKMYSKTHDKTTEKLTFTVMSHAVRCRVLRETLIQPEVLLQGTLQTNTEGLRTQNSCNDLKLGFSGRPGAMTFLQLHHTDKSMPASVLNYTSALGLAQEPGINQGASKSDFSCYALVTEGSFCGSRYQYCLNDLGTD